MSGRDVLADVTWDAAEAATLLALLARRSTRTREAVPIPPAPRARTPEELDAWVTGAAPLFSSEALGHAVQYRDVLALLASRKPLILSVGSGESFGLIGLIGGSRFVTLLTNTGGMRRMKLEQFRVLLCGSVEASIAPIVDRFIEGSGLTGRKLDRARRALLLRHAGDHFIGHVWSLEPGADATFFAALWRTGMGWQLGSYVAAYTLHYVALLAAWAVVGRWALSGSFAIGWFAEWLLLLASVAALFAFCRWSAGVMSIRINAVLQERLLTGALKFNRDRLRREGASHLLGRVLESNTIQTTMLEGVFGVSVVVLEAAFAIAVLSLGAGGAPHAAAFVLWLAALVTIHWMGYKRRGRWADQRVGLTHDLVEKMIGNRTRIVQQRASRWHDGEDEALCHYYEAGRSADQMSVLAETTAVRAWIIVGVAGLIPSILSGAGAAQIAIAIGGILLAESALIRLLAAGTSMAEGAVAWRNVRDVVQAAQQPEIAGTAVAMDGAALGNAPVLSCHDVVFRHEGRSVAVLDRCTLEIRRGDRVLIQGESGSGKSTLCALLSAMRHPESGLVLLHGLDHRTVGSALWRRRVASTLQFHENHVFTESFAFNLLMGRRWPPTAGDLHEARDVCRELGMGDLLERMPGGLFQVIGEYGWQLSHGERSRLFVARALLQRADVIVLDESFGALDPGTFEQTLQCVLRRAPTLAVVAHP